jgi:hypothetical protein
MATRKIKIRYLKAYDFKISIVTGVYGGVTSNGLINVNFFNERAVIPDSSTVEVNEAGIIVGQPVDERDGDIMRELQSGLLMDVNTAKVIIKWLESKIKDQERIQKTKDESKS